MTDHLPGASFFVASIPQFPTDGSIKTLGWDVIDWIEGAGAYGHLGLVDPNGEGHNLVLTREQRTFTLYFYAVDDDGVWLYRRAVLRRAKGWGKSPFLGAIALAELCGPCSFAGWDADGEAVGRPHPRPVVHIAGVSLMQTKNTLDAVRTMASGSAIVDAYGLDVGLTRIRSAAGGELIPVTSSSATLEGARPTFAILDETHHWTATNGGHKLAKVIRRNLGKVDGRSIETTNAHEPGADSTAERSYLSWRAIVEGRSKATGLLYDTREALPDTDLANEDSLRQGLRAAYGDSYWVNLDRILAEVYDPDTPPEEARRFYLNQIVAAADSWITPGEWHATRSGAKGEPEIGPLLLGEAGHKTKTGDTVALGFDGSLTDDSTALVAVRIDDGAPFLLAIWEKPEGPQGQGWQVPKADVRNAVDWAFAHLDVVAFFSDVAYWETDVDAWRDEYGEKLLVKATQRHAIGWDMRGHQMDTTRAVENLHRNITDGELPWRSHELLAGSSAGLNAAEILTRHVLNARRRPNRWGVAFGKETRESPKKVDALAALVLARMARTRVLADGVLKKRRKAPGRLYGF